MSSSFELVSLFAVLDALARLDDDEAGVIVSVDAVTGTVDEDVVVVGDLEGEDIVEELFVPFAGAVVVEAGADSVEVEVFGTIFT